MRQALNAILLERRRERSRTQPAHGLRLVDQVRLISVTVLDRGRGPAQPLAPPTRRMPSRENWRCGKIGRKSSGESAEECNDLADLGIRKRDPKLNTAHDLDGFLQRRD
jgi:hypothetical protein